MDRTRAIKVLIVDDDAAMVENIHDFLLESFPQADIHTCHDGSSAYDIAFSTKFDVICTDYRMPGLNGAELINRLREVHDSLNYRTPFVFITGYREEARREIKNTDNVFFLNKPFDPDNLTLYVDSAMLSTHISLIELNQHLIVSQEELKQAQAQLVQSAKLASLGEMSAGIAHELNNPLTAVEGYARLIEKAKDFETVHKQSHKIIRSVGRMKNVVSHLRAFAQQSSEKNWRPIDINRPIRDSLILLQEQLKICEISTRLSLAPDLSLVLGNQSQLESVFHNLVMNSRDAFLEIPEKANKFIRIKSEKVDLSKVLVTYEDNATGMSQDVADKIYEPFFSTKEDGLASGLGMSLAYGIIRQHQGQISLDTEYGKGVCFSIVFPTTKEMELMDEDIEPLHETPRVHLVQNDSESTTKRRVLIVDDEPDICEILSFYLEDYFQVVANIDPEDVIKKLESESYDLIVTDLKMPKVSGAEICQKVWQLSPTTPVVIMSAHILNLKDLNMENCKYRVGFIKKPFGNPDSVIEYLHRMLSD